MRSPIDKQTNATNKQTKLVTKFPKSFYFGACKQNAVNALIIDAPPVNSLTHFQFRVRWEDVIIYYNIIPVSPSFSLPLLHKYIHISTVQRYV